MILSNVGGYFAGIKATLYDYSGKILGEYDTGYLKSDSVRKYQMPKNTYRIHIYVAVKLGKRRHFDFYASQRLKENSYFSFESQGLWGTERFVYNGYGWSEKKDPEYSHEESIQFKSYFNADNPNMYFKATFYGYDYQIDEKSVKLSNIGFYPRETVVNSETIKIPNGTTSIKVEIIKEGKLLDSATLKYNPAKKSKDDITITLGHPILGWWNPMEFNYPECWEKIK